MKKNISINISGIIFHIEEDGFERLREYLDSINKYFSTFDDSTEIIADIESRIAEIFLSTLKEGRREVITKEDVESVVATMGTIADFKAAEEDTKEKEPQPTREGPTEERGDDNSEQAERPSKLYRDLNKQVIGGVASGLAYYFKIDPLWVRLILVIFLLNIFIGFGLSGFILISYIIAWIVIPGSKNLAEDKQIKKMYRSSDDQVLGGVASGIAAYFGADITLIRLLFVLSIFLGGSGLIIYIILWIITPEAKSITEKMEMQGEPVTLSNIEHTVKDRMNEKEGQEESAASKILLFPFRVIAAIFKGLSELLGPVLKFFLEALRVIIALVLIVTSLCLIFALIVTTIVSFGVFTGMETWLNFQDLPIEVFQGAIPNGSLFFLFISLFIPALALGLLGFTILFKNTVTNSYVGWALFGIWLIGLIGASVTIPGAVADFYRRGEVTISQDYELTGNAAYLRLNQVDMQDYDGANLALRGHDQPVFTLVQDFESRGNNLEDARQNARMVDYTVVHKDSVITFDSNITFKSNAKFRFQELSMVLYIPYDKVFYMENDLEYILRNTIYRSGYSTRDIPNNQWVFDENGLQCLTCSGGRKRRSREDARPRSSEQPDSNVTDKLTFDFEDFDEVKASDRFDISIVQGDDYNVEFTGRETDLDRIRVQQRGDELQMQIRNWSLSSGSRRPIKVEITMPQLEQLKLRDACSAEIDNMKGEQIDIELSDSADADLVLDYKEVSVELSESSDIVLSGQAEEIDVDLSGTASMQAHKLETGKAKVVTTGGSSATVFVSKELKARAWGASDIRYLGDPELDADEGRSGSVKRYDLKK